MRKLIGESNELRSPTGLEYNHIIGAQIFYNGKDKHVSDETISVDLLGNVSFTKDEIGMSTRNRKDSLSVRLVIETENQELWLLDIGFHKGWVLTESRIIEKDYLEKFNFNGWRYL